jgi:hypothetical protein
VRRLLLIAFFFEIGFALLVVPWSAFWDRNYFAEALPPIHAFITNNFVRGAVSGLGLVNIFAGLGEIIAILLARNMESSTTPFSATPLTKD